ncbi:glycosyltransferase family 2 protein [uncultured Prevotella sp.]|uniref:glycosyltransferase family 2 protein n=1 Tax=uncultured Prevotella sp. TaxID=159272 RepID=UPI0025855C0B|nr:glycosyltransferase family 2 protein [uncultured Prevotella sp.]
MAYEVTIGIPVYNVEKYIRESLESALAQSFQSIEFLICDDCGTDSSIAIVQEFQNVHPRGADIRIVHQSHNMGLGCARNRMIEEAKGRYIYFMDSDDLLASNAIELMYEQAQKYDADMVYGSMEKVLLYENGRRVKNSDYSYRVFLQEDEFASWVYEKYDRIQASTCNFLIRIDVYRQNGIKYKPINYWEDFTTTMDLPTYVTRVVMLNDVTYFYMCRSGSMSNYQYREYIPKEEILQTMNAVAMIKENSKRILEKPYFSNRMLKVMTTCFFICCTILRNRYKIEPKFDKKELRDFMHYPVAFHNFLSFRTCLLKHVLLYSMGVLPAFLSVGIMCVIGKNKHLV